MSTHEDREAERALLFIRLWMGRRLLTRATLRLGRLLRELEDGEE